MAAKRRSLTSLQVTDTEVGNKNDYKMSTRFSIKNFDVYKMSTQDSVEVDKSEYANRMGWLFEPFLRKMKPSDF